MFFANLLSAALLVAGPALAAPTPSANQVPLDGFPNPNSTQLDVINTIAQGTLSNAPPPPSLNASSVPIFQLIAFNENFEVAFFQSLLNNITGNVAGYEIPGAVRRDAVINVLNTVLAQEELHAINAAGVVKHFGGFVPVPCVYSFPTTDLAGALALAETFTSLVLGTLQDAAQGLARNGDIGPVRAIASVIGQEGEQNGFYRVMLDRVPSAQPFLTTSVAAFAFSALQDFVVSCPFVPADNIPIPIFPTMAVSPINTTSEDGGIVAEDQQLSFSANLSSVAAAAAAVAPYTATGAGTGLYVTYLSGQDLPISEPITNVTWDSTTSVLTFEAFFPYDQFTMNGLTLAALTNASNFTTADELPAHTLAAPGLIEVSDLILY